MPRKAELQDVERAALRTGLLEPGWNLFARAREAQAAGEDWVVAYSLARSGHNTIGRWISIAGPAVKDEFAAVWSAWFDAAVGIKSSVEAAVGVHSC